MDQATQVKPLPSNTMTKSTCSATPSYTPPNPYARDSSRRAIACVSCAKAKTRCDKAVRRSKSPLGGIHAYHVHSSHHALVASPKASNAIRDQHAAPQTITTVPCQLRKPSYHPSASPVQVSFHQRPASLRLEAHPPDHEASCEHPPTSTSARQSR